MIDTKDLDRKVYDEIDPLGETLSSVVWAIKASYYNNLGFTPGQTVFSRDILFNLTSIIGWRIITTSNQRQVNIDNVFKNVRQFSLDNAIGDIVYV